jgi:NitT/TauT family transport system ATP-binding protein
MIEVEDLQIKYGSERALHGIDFKLKRNKTCAVIGPSGCGKTTLIYTLAGLIKPDRGEVYINSRQLNGVRKDTAVILQEYGLLPWKTVWQNVALGLKVRKKTEIFIKNGVNKILQELKIERLRGKYPTELSGGERQRVAIGRALALSPDLLLMDEPSSSLDAITKEHIQDLVLRIYKEDPKTMVLVTHSIEEAVFLGQKIVIMGQGKIKNILKNPHFGDEKLRTKMDFYKICLKVRNLMDDGDKQ